MQNGSLSTDIKDTRHEHEKVVHLEVKVVYSHKKTQKKKYIFQTFNVSSVKFSDKQTVFSGGVLQANAVYSFLIMKYYCYISTSHALHYSHDKFILNGR